MTAQIIDGNAVATTATADANGNWSDTVRYQPIPFLSLDGYIRLPSTPR